MAAMFLLMILNMAYAKDYEISKKSGDYNVQVKIDKNPPATGSNKMDVSIKDSMGMEIKDATVIIEYIMPAMPGMPAMNYKASTEAGTGSYLSVLDFSMSGPWTINIKITSAGKTQTVKLNVDVK
jgi:hypothetical protein